MKPGLSVCLGMATSLWITVARAEMTAEQAQQIEAFKAGVLALDPHTQKSEPLFQSLVGEYVAATGPVQVFLDFMTASGFRCPPIGSLSPEVDREVPRYRCSFEADVGPTGEPSLSSVTEGTSFVATAYCDKDRNITTIAAQMIHGFTGP